jgi:hypothetical protein
MKHINSQIVHARIEKPFPAAGVRRQGCARTMLVASGAAAVLLISGCGGSPSSLSAAVDGRAQ